MTIPYILLKSGKDRPLRQGHPWVFSGAIKDITEPDFQTGIVQVLSNKREPLGVGYYNRNSQIRVRLFSQDATNVIDREWVTGRVKKALEYRNRFLSSDTDAYRVIYAEADGLPGMIVDRYGAHYVIQCHTASSELIKPWVVDAIKESVSPESIIERSELNVRKHEGLDVGFSGAILGDIPQEPITIQENGLKFLVDLAHGQKTGFFIDQRDNRKRVQELARGDVANVYSFSGATTVAALAGGADSVTSIDTDASALALAEQNIAANNVANDKHESICQDARRTMQSMAQEGKQFDLVILDPPAFAKNRGAVRNALQAYKRINRLAIQLLRPGGLLLSCSCSGLVNRDQFRNVIKEAAGDTGVPVILQGEFTQPLDHPVTPAYPEGEYLKSTLLYRR